MGTSGAASTSHQAAGNKLFKEGFLDEAICAYDLALEGDCRPLGVTSHANAQTAECAADVAERGAQ